MRIRVLAGLGVGLLSGLGMAQTAAKPLHADRVVVLKKERTLQLFIQGQVVKTYKVALDRHSTELVRIPSLLSLCHLQFPSPAKCALSDRLK